ncbi:hypothetical protein [Chroogloeocystis siderophila]|jgi:hypothetical protein|uniref:Uncharacterized protein n=1 Tax=Chroogloeocystis siderophila 5.2 s.c.1 TaxID=247279 RepID=A0A1U7HP49_9CHRO|nr:hypothetical protein [Chroogloeocystis siderophila]OKH25341.1 hypothetical protein NIES1031_13205 [Chroogloeocystis siderophila 5.2 s.c.1]
MRIQKFLQTTSLSAIATIILAACAPANQTTTTPPQTTELPAGVSIPGVTNVGEINFRTTSTGAQGFFDGVNGSNAPRIEVSGTEPINVYGWAILTNKGRPADNVIITYGDNNAVVAVAPVNVERPDVAKVLNNSAFANSGWNINFDASTLPEGSLMLKAWAYDSEAREATQLTTTREVVITR